MKSNTDTQFWRDLKHNRQHLTKQQYRTLKGQAVKGHVMDARKGLQRILHRRVRVASGNLSAKG